VKLAAKLNNVDYQSHAQKRAMHYLAFLLAFSLSRSLTLDICVTANPGAQDLGYCPFDATNASKHLINQSEERILQIDQSKSTSTYLYRKVNLETLYQSLDESDNF